ncbi:hypothetical protein LX81_02138 [Palleronia aestuarii]|uniref:DUF1127 domain-containing protein n=1 Tax=Palleronia aestuarii TaxID=568105 RepID=A0A2W7NSM0_9RHOB|nr:DUF1127 domain-containing protein [Palleronia aestuarii]PZX16286.1 hypothetical protein LX81_02138 [Palleronia aestuarii]
MHATIKHHAPLTGLRQALANGYARFSETMVLIMESQARTKQVERLNAKSDAELAKLGLRRQDIVRHVFRDVMYY